MPVASAVLRSASDDVTLTAEGDVEIGRGKIKKPPQVGHPEAVSFRRTEDTRVAVHLALTWLTPR